MWKCFSCGRHLGMVENKIWQAVLVCPYCGSDDVTKIEEGSSLAKEAAANSWGHFYSSKVQEPYPYQVTSKVGSDYGTMCSIQNDAFVMNSLGKCGVDYPTTFSLVWGDRIACSDGFPFELRKIVSDIIQEEKKKEESIDPWDKRLHGIIIDLLYVLYEKQVNDLVVNVLGNK